MGAAEGVSTPRIAILTVTTNAAAHLPAYLDALERVTYPAWELWAVDNGSRDGSAAMVRERMPGARVLENGENLGFTGACNRALREILARPDIGYVLFLNDDTEVTPGFLEPLAALADARTLVAPKTYLAGQPGILDDAAGAFDWWRGTWRRRVLGRREGPADCYPHAIETANLSCLLVPAGAFREVGLLDDAFFVYYDDTDFCRRARAAGYRIFFEPRSVVYHRKGATLGGQASAFGCYYLARNRPYLIRKHRGLLPFAAFFAYYAATRAARMGLWLGQGRADLARATAAGMRDFVLGRMGPRR
ncbi:glycosyltransferase family 2 protein [Tepidiforma flava]|uniref:Glycosyltransferase family 2 protein n=1 Tax=Tepidiforma flava TaxID=3004094 RepID=A0ABY7M896_9CHLR|nr:glycosyltransferase family 2 protein [Tepidiforma flava]WBL36757.1 glycosyltransferase family 2 protein [Tepidiforma flava]